MRSVCLFAMVFGLSVATLSSVAQDVAVTAEKSKAEKAELKLEGKKAIATVQAEEWLAYVDSGKYTQSWDYAAPFLQKHYERGHWSRSMEVSLVPLGAVVSRKVRDVEHYTKMAGGPDRDYVIIRYDTVFKNRPAAEESVTMMWQLHEPRWRVAGYFIK